MEISGKIIAVLEARSGQSRNTGNTWTSQEYVLETSDQYPKRVCFNLWGEDKIRQFNIQQGQELTVSFDIDAHEYQGRWFNSIRAWKVEPFVPNASASQPMSADSFAPAAPFPPAAPSFESTDNNSQTDDLPF